LLWMGWTGRIGGGGNSASRTTQAPLSPIENVENQRLTVGIIASQAIIPEGARIALIEFSDFECPYCLRFSTETLPQLRRDFVDSKKIAYGFRHNPIEGIHPRAFDAALGSSCAAEQGKFWLFHDLIFGASDAIRRPMPVLAKELMLNVTRFKQCLLENEHLVRSDQAEAERLGISSTPTFLLGTFRTADEISVMRRIVGAQSYDTFKTAIEQVLTP